MPNIERSHSDYLSTAQAAELLGVHVTTLNRWEQQGRIAAAVKAPGLRGAKLYLRSDVEQLAERRSA